MESVIVESFEASPAAGSVLSSPNALLCEFPGVAVSVPLSQFLQTPFLKSLSAFLEQATIEPIKRFAAHTRKAGVDVAGYRDTTDPALITQMLMTLLEAYGTCDRPAILRKRIRDDVCWEDSEQP